MPSALINPVCLNLYKYMHAIMFITQRTYIHIVKFTLTHSKQKIAVFGNTKRQTKM